MAIDSILSIAALNPNEVCNLNCNIENGELKLNKMKLRNLTYLLLIARICNHECSEDKFTLRLEKMTKTL
jgi:hypothetical protein